MSYLEREEEYPVYSAANIMGNPEGLKNREVLRIGGKVIEEFEKEFKEKGVRVSAGARSLMRSKRICLVQRTTTIRYY
jgi:hypothetical protein